MDIKKLREYEDRGYLRSQTHPEYPLIIWNYTENAQFEDFWDEVTLSCRGLVTDTDGNVIARPFKKFFNIEKNKFIPTNKFEVFEKMDGSLIILFKYKDTWIVATRGSFISDQAIHATELFKKYNLNELNENYTYLFEYISSNNRIVVDYGSLEDLFLLGVIETRTGIELSYEDLKDISNKIKFTLVKRYDGIKDYTELKSGIKPNQEGYVVLFSNGDRVKIKGEEYIRLHKIISNLSTKSVWEALMEYGDPMIKMRDVPDEFHNTIKEYSYFLKNKYNLIYHEILLEYYKILLSLPYNHTKRDFAMIAKDHKYSKALFMQYTGKILTVHIWKMIQPKYEKLI